MGVIAEIILKNYDADWECLEIGKAEAEIIAEIEKCVNEVTNEKCRDKHHDDRSCPTCETKTDTIDDILDNIKKLKGEL